MIVKKRKYHFLLIVMMLCTSVAFAQNDQPVEEPVVDTIKNFSTEEPPPEEPYTNTYQSGTTTDYFLPKYLPDAALDSLKMRRIPDSAVAALRGDEDFWYANHVFTKEKEKTAEKRRTGISSSLNTLLWIFIIGGFITFLVIYLINSNVAVLRSSRSVKSKEEEELVEMDNIFGINYPREIERAINAGNYRLAVRLMFLRTLRQLSDKKVIQYKQDRTNFDYLMQMSNTVWYKPFFRLARNYEYVWYGKFDIDQRQFDNIRNEFTDLERQL